MITTSMILSNYEQEAIFAFYGFNVEYNKRIKCPLYEDKSPSSYFFWSGIKLYFKDYGSQLVLDVFRLALYYHKYILGENNIEIDIFGRASNEHYQKLAPKLIFDDIDNQKGFKPKIIETPKEKEPTKILFEYRHWDILDYKYFLSYNIDIKDCEAELLYPSKNIWINENYHKQMENLPANPTYSILCDKEKFKIYKPYAEKIYKWRSNYTAMYYSYHNIDVNSDKKILVTSVKDKMALKSMFKELNLNVYCVSSETWLKKGVKLPLGTAMYIGDGDKDGLVAIENVKESNPNVYCIPAVDKDIAADVKTSKRKKKIHNLREHYKTQLKNAGIL